VAIGEKMMGKSKSGNVTAFRFRDVRAKIRQTMLGQLTVDEVAVALLDSGWDARDPKGLMIKPADEVRDFLRNVSVEVSLWSDLSLPRRNLMKMICDAYCRSLVKQMDDA